MLRFDGRVAVVTGSGRGLGRSYALLLASRGAQVVVNDFGGELDGSGLSSGPAESVVEEISARGGSGVAAPFDISTSEGGTAVVETALRAFGRVDMVVHNAGAGQSLHRCIAIHLMGAFNILVPTWDLMRDQAFGRIVLTTSASALWSRSFPTPAEKGPDDFGYGASKGGLLGLTNELAYFGKPFNINVNAIAPYGRTRMNVPSTGIDGTSGPVVGQFFEQAAPDLVAPVVAWLLHEDCTVSHEVLAAGAGRVSRIFLAETNGIVDPDLTIEAVRDRWGAIEDRDAYRVYDNGLDALLRWAEDIKLDR